MVVLRAQVTVRVDTEEFRYGKTAAGITGTLP
jgi:hypothetical protein